MGAGWARFEWQGWEVDRLDFPRPWPRRWVHQDLRFWHDPKACGGVPRPSVRELAATWGWSRSAVHRLLQPECIAQWMDPQHAAGQERDSAGTALGQERDTDTPDNANNGDSVGHRRDSAGTGAGQERDASLGDTGAHTSTSTSTSGGSPPTPPAGGDGKQSKPRKADLVQQAAERVYAHWRSYVPRAEEVAAPSRLERLAKAIRERSTANEKHTHAQVRERPLQAAEEQLVAICDWHFQAPAAAHWRGQNDRNTRYLTVEAIYKPGRGDRATLAARYDDTREWIRQHRPVAPDAVYPAGHVRADGEAALAAWERLLRLRLPFEREVTAPEEALGDDALGLALRRWLVVVSWQSVVKATDAEVFVLRDRFKADFPGLIRDVGAG